MPRHEIGASRDQPERGKDRLIRMTQRWNKLISHMKLYAQYLPY